MERFYIKNSIYLDKLKRVCGTNAKPADNCNLIRSAQHPETADELIGQYLQYALPNSELYLQYQPQYNTKVNQIETFEALLRWKNPVLGTVVPASFIKVAEETGLIVPIGEWVLRNACRFIQKIHQAGGTNCRIGVNVSMAQLKQENFVEQVLSILQKTGLSSGFLELELTELLPQVALEHLNDKLRLLKAWEIGIALDDFGTGYASLSCLNQLRVDTLKIDKSFIDGILQHKENDVLVRSIIGIGRELDLEVIAEGVENAAQADRLAECGCHRIQGNFYSEPVSAIEALRMIKTGFWPRPLS